ncbi:MAG: hypothetical protein CSA26_08665 [Desulfobacterales bacterium]|nr:MAG: hypothetical protein CSA26_08665 [Desulfobacterales bacterium]
MDVDFVPFIYNRGENDIRMTKVQQKISGCFQPMEGGRFYAELNATYRRVASRILLPRLLCSFMGNLLIGRIR